MSGSIVDEPVEVPAEVSASEGPSLADVAEMVFLLFEAVKDLEAKIDEHFSA